MKIDQCPKCGNCDDSKFEIVIDTDEEVIHAKCAICGREEYFVY
jgi:transcription elongation factor Elf1